MENTRKNIENVGMARADAVLKAKFPDADPRFLEILDELEGLHRKKGADYGTGEDHFANVRSSEDFGLPAYLGVLIRMNDKMQRMKQFARKGALENESFEDSLYDLASYAIIALILYREATDADL